MKGKMIKQKGFARKLHQRLATRVALLKENKNLSEAELASLARLQELTDQDLDIIITDFWEELATLLHSGMRIIFEGWISFFTKPVKRKCYNMKSGASWWTFKRRIRSTGLDGFRLKAEVEITEAEYLAEKENAKKKEN